MLLDPELHYLDNAATTMVDPEIAGAIHEALLKDWANPSSLYEPAVETHEALTTARGQIARTLGCQAKDLYFTSCGSESNNLAVQGLAMARKNWGSKIVVSGFEHPSVQRPIRALKDRGFEVVEILPEADGHLDVAKLAAEVDKNTVLVSCMAVNNETGTLQDIAALSTAVKAKNSRCAVHVDAVQAWLRIPIDLKKWKNVELRIFAHHARRIHLHAFRDPEETGIYVYTSNADGLLQNRGRHRLLFQIRDCVAFGEDEGLPQFQIQRD